MTASIVFAVVLLVAGHRCFVAGLATGFVCGLSVRPTKDLEGRSERRDVSERARIEALSRFLNLNRSISCKKTSD